MVGYIIISVFVLVLVLLVYLEYRNEKKYQVERRQRRPSVKKEEKKSVIKPTKVPSAKELEAKKEQEKRLEERRVEERELEERKLEERKLEERRVEERRLEERRVEERRLEERKLEERRLEERRVEERRLEERRLEEKKPEPKNIAVSLADYPKFDHSRLIEMGLSEEEAKEFVAELIPQIGAQIPLIKEAMAISDFHNLEQLTHSVKGSSTTVGTGGISDLLADFNTYLKTGKEPAIIEAYIEQLNHYYEELKEQYT